MGASLNVFINTKMMKNREYASKINNKANKMLEEGKIIADVVYAEIEKSLLGVN
jgi:formiminotetrahydrofolate cyclodeaminase